ncbi:MAG: TolC family protein, partial [Candidatus Latescibacteria bacterium]|nr:TolC family protein [Candidatus Latescibacterota bacterium]
RLGLTLPIFRGGESWGQLQQQRARLRHWAYELEDEQNRIELEVRKAFFGLMDAKERLELQKERVEITKQRLEIVESLIEFEWARYLTYEDILRRRQDFHQAQQDYFTFRRQYVMAAEDLRKALGEK